MKESLFMLLAGVEFDHELLVDDRVDLFAAWQAVHLATEAVAVLAEPVGNDHGLREVESAEAHLLSAGALLHGDHITRFHLSGSDVALRQQRAIVEHPKHDELGRFMENMPIAIV